MRLMRSPGGTDSGWFSAAVLTNGEQSWESGMSVLNGDMADNYDDMSISGLVRTQAIYRCL